MAEAEIGIGVKVDLGDAKRAFKDELPKLAKDVVKEWATVGKAIEESGPGGLGEAGKLSLERHRRLASELAERASRRGHWFRDEKRDYDSHYREVERLAKRHHDAQVKIAKDSLPAMREAEKQFRTIQGQWQSLGPAGRAAMQPDLDRARKRYVDLSNEVEGPAERLQQTQQQLHELRSTADLLDVKTRPQQPRGWLRSAARVGGRLLGFGTAAGAGYWLASRLRSGIEDETERAMQVADMAQRLRVGMSGTEFEEMALAQPTLRPHEATKFLATYGTVAGARDIRRIPEAIALTRGFGFTPEYGAQTFGQVQRLGLDQRSFATAMGEEIARAQMRGREGEVFESVIRMSEALIQRVGKVDSIEPIASLMGRLGATGIPGLQGEYGAQVVSGVDAAFRGTDMFGLPDLKRPMMWSLFAGLGITNPAEMMRIQEGGVLSRPDLLKGIVQQIERFGGVKTPMGAMAARSFNIPLGMYEGIKDAASDDKKMNTLQFLEGILGPQMVESILMGGHLPNAQAIAMDFQGRAQRGEFAQGGLREQLIAALKADIGEMDTFSRFRANTAAVSQTTTRGSRTIAKGAAMMGNLAADSLWGSSSRIFSGSPEAIKGSPLYERRQRYMPLIDSTTRIFGLPQNLLASIAEHESGFWENVPTRPGDGVGLMQIKPRTAGMTAEQLKDPYTNIMAAGKHVRYLLDKYSGNIEKVVAAYNAGEGAVDQALKYGNAWQSHLPRGETKDEIPFDTNVYRSKVMDTMAGLNRLTGEATIYVRIVDEKSGKQLGHATVPLVEGTGPTTSPGEYRDLPPQEWEKR